MIDAILSQIEGENSKYIFGPSLSVMTKVVKKIQYFKKIFQYFEDIR